MKRVSLVHQGAVGDTALLVPLITSLRAKYAADGGASVTIVSRPSFGQMLNMLGIVERFSSAEEKAHANWFGEGADAKPTEWSDCDVLISAVSNGHDTWAANARKLSTAQQILFFNPRPRDDYPGHVTDWQREQLITQGLELPVPPLPLLHKNPDGVLVIHPGSGGEPKCWPRDRFLQLGRDLKRNGIVPTLILGEAEQERWGHKVVRELQDEFPWYLHMGLYELAEKLSRARLYLGNDSGVSHLAAMTGVPTITLFGPSNDQQWRPIGPQVTVLRAPPPHERNLEALDVATVLAEILAELRKFG